MRFKIYFLLRNLDSCYSRVDRKVVVRKRIVMSKEKVVLCLKELSSIEIKGKYY